MPVEVNDTRLQSVRDSLERVRATLESYDNAHWPFFDDSPVSAKQANKFLLGCVIDFRQRYDVAWSKAKELAETELRNPENLWKAVASIPKNEWDSRTGPRSLHSTSARHRKVRDIAIKIDGNYSGDARTIWQGHSAGEVLDTLENELLVGPQVARMVVGALLDEEQLNGVGDVKADIHVRRTVGRCFAGAITSEEEATRITRLLDPENPWRNDYLLWKIGRDYCKPRTPECEGCPLASCCRYILGKGAGMADDVPFPVTGAAQDPTVERNPAPVHCPCGAVSASLPALEEHLSTAHPSLNPNERSEVVGATRKILSA